jgi:hypothetical protein
MNHAFCLIPVCLLLVGCAAEQVRDVPLRDLRCEDDDDCQVITRERAEGCRPAGRPYAVAKDVVEDYECPQLNLWDGEHHGGDWEAVCSNRRCRARSSRWILSPRRYEMKREGRPDSLLTIGGFGLARTGHGNDFGGGGELAYWRRVHGTVVYGGADIGVSDRSAYAELQVSREFGEWPSARQVIVGVGLGPGIRLRADENGQRPLFGQATLWGTFRFEPSKLPSPLFPFIRVEVSSAGTSWQGGLMLKVGLW